MTDQDRAEFEKWADETLTDDYCDDTSAMDKTRAAWLAARRTQDAKVRELRTMLDELLLAVEGESVYLCDDVWAVADRIKAQLKEPRDEVDCI